MARRGVKFDFHTGQDWCTPRWCAPRNAASGRGATRACWSARYPSLRRCHRLSGSPNVRRWTIWEIFVRFAFCDSCD